MHTETLTDERYLSRTRNGNPLQYSCLENPMDRGAWWAAVHGVAKTWLNDFTFTFHFHALEKEMTTHSRVLAWRDGGAWWAAVYGVAQSRTRLKWLSSSRVRYVVKYRSKYQWNKIVHGWWVMCNWGSMTHSGASSSHPVLQPGECLPFPERPWIPQDHSSYSILPNPH